MLRQCGSRLLCMESLPPVSTVGFTSSANHTCKCPTHLLCDLRLGNIVLEAKNRSQQPNIWHSTRHTYICRSHISRLLHLWVTPILPWGMGPSSSRNTYSRMIPPTTSVHFLKALHQTGWCLRSRSRRFWRQNHPSKGREQRCKHWVGDRFETGGCIMKLGVSGWAEGCWHKTYHWVSNANRMPYKTPNGQEEQYGEKLQIWNVSKHNPKLSLSMCSLIAHRKGRDIIDRVHQL